MARLTLRAYIREIERLVERGQTDQAIAHCRYILQYFPRYVGAYRLLGKAFLESQRYGDAADILQRVLSSVPEDFVSHVGMSIIREDEGNYDESIWHMERAFEVQPANGAIQDELRRLYGSRDGMEPPRIRLTRGALARMYYNGDLFQQAVAEINTVLTRDPSRFDMRVLLAQVYMEAGQKNEAAEAAGLVLQKLPNCLVAIRIMADVFAGSDREEDIQAYRRILQGLDPYAAYINTEAPTSELVPDQAINLEKLVWKPGQAPIGSPGQPEWAASLGVDLVESGPKQDALPEWLTGASAEQADKTSEKPALPPRESSAPAFAPEALTSDEQLPDWLSEPGSGEDLPDVSTGADKAIIPDWMQDAGWAPDSGAFDESKVSLTDEEPVIDQADELAQAEIPQWLQEMAPSEQPEPLSEAQIEADSEFLSFLEDGDKSEEAGSMAVPYPEGTPELSSDFDSEADIESGGALPDWLLEADAVQTSELSERPPITDAVPAAQRELPDWLAEPEDLAASPPTPDSAEEDGSAEDKSLPDWLKAGAAAAAVGAGAILAAEALDGEPAPEEESPETPAMAEEEPLAEAELPDWLLEVESAEIPTETAAPTEVHVPIEEKSLTEAELPDWLMGIEGIEAPTEAAPIPEASAPVEEALAEAELPDWLTEVEDVDVPPVQQALDEEITEEEAGIPDWLKAGAAATTVAAGAVLAADALDEESASQEAPLEALAPTEEEPLAEAELPDWLLEVEGIEASPEAAPAVELPAEIEDETLAKAELPDWLLEADGLEAPPETASPAEAPAAAEEEPLAEAELPEWLMEATYAEAPEEVPSALEESSLAEAELPEWLMEAEGIEALDEAAPTAEVPAAVEEEPLAETELPEWLLEAESIEALDEAAPTLEVLAAVEEEPLAETELPAWLLEAEGIEAIDASEEAALAAELSTAADEEPLAEAELPEWLLEAEGIEAIEAPDEAAPALEVPTATEEEPLAETELPAWLLEAEDFEAPSEAAPPPEVPATIERKPLGEAEMSADEDAEQPGGLAVGAAAAVIGAGVALAADALMGEPAEEEVPPISPEPTPEPSAEAPADLGEMDEDAAFAWLESLAVKQGADEALLLTPEERTEAPPEWIEQTMEESISPEEVEPVEGEAAPIEALTEIPGEVAVEEAPPSVDEAEVISLADTQPSRIIPPGEEIGTSQIIDIEPVDGEPPKAEVPEPETVPATAEPPSTPEAAVEPLVEAPEEMDRMDEDAAFAWLESLAVQQGADEALLLTPEERAETPPEWVQQAAQEEDVLIPAEEDLAEVDAFYDETVGEVIDGVYTKEEADISDGLPTPAVVGQPVRPSDLPEEPEPGPDSGTESEALDASEAVSDIMDDDAAFAWLESLAVSQGADEALLLTPEERTDIPPDWIQESGAEKPALEVVEQPLKETDLPAFEEWGKLEGPPAEVSIETEQPEAAMPFADEATLDEETKAAEQAEDEDVPDLPSWLEEGLPETGKLEWTPPPTPERKLELNSASLVELERLPSVGFIMAQRIVNYRDTYGPFTKLEDLLQVTGFSQPSLNDLKDVIYIEEIEESSIPEMPPIFSVTEEPISLDEEEEPSPELLAARTALEVGNLEDASAKYAELIKSREALPRVIRDLKEAVTRYPTEVGFWQNLGDAHLRSDQINEALEAYKMAEELL